MNPRILILTVLALLVFGSSAFAAPIFADTAYDYSAGAGVSTARSVTGNALGAFGAKDRANMSRPEIG